jgi:PKD repeat protein
VQLAVTSDKGCADTVMQQANILPTPDVQYSVSDACAGDQVQFINNTAFNGSVGNLNYNWVFGDQSGSSNPSVTHTYDTLGEYETSLRVRSNDGCVDTATQQVTINGLPEPDFTFENTCDPRAVDLTNTTGFGGDTSNLDYTWDLEGNSVNVEEAVYTFSNAQTYQVELEATNTNGNCVETITKDVEVKPQATAEFSVADICAGEEASFTYEGNNPAQAYNWDLATTTSSMENPAVAYEEPGSYDVSLTVNYYDGKCTKDTTQTLEVNPVPTADFTFGTEGPVCQGDEVEFLNNSTFENGDVSSLTYDWAIGSTGLSGESPSFPFEESGSFDVELTARSTEGCESTFSLSKAVNPTPTSDFTVDKVGPDQVRLSAQDNTYLNYDWNLGDSTTASSPSLEHTYDSNRTYNITLMVEDRAGCTSSASEKFTIQTVGIGDQPEASSSNIEAYPNPFQNVARIQYNVDQQADVQLDVYTTNGQNLVTKTYNDRPAGSYSFNLKADQDLPTGSTYMIRLQIGDEVHTKQLIRQQ